MLALTHRNIHLSYQQLPQAPQKGKEQHHLRCRQALFSLLPYFLPGIRYLIPLTWELLHLSKQSWKQLMNWADCKMTAPAIVGQAPIAKFSLMLSGRPKAHSIVCFNSCSVF